MDGRFAETEGLLEWATKQLQPSSIPPRGPDTVLSLDAALTALGAKKEHQHDHVSIMGDS